jgi:AcrR family transcriptional regulator
MVDLNEPFRYVKGTQLERLMVPADASTARRTSIGSRRNPATEAAVLDAARNLLTDKGYAGFSIEEVARRAGAGKPTIYRWWPTKADLFIAIYSAEKAAAVAPPDTGNLAQDLVEYTVRLWSFWRANPAGSAFRALIAEAQASASALKALRDKFLPERLGDVRAMFERAVARKELQPQDLENAITLWIGFNWFRLLTDQISIDRDLIARIVGAIVGARAALAAAKLSGSAARSK